MGDISLNGYHGTSSHSMKSIELRGLDPAATKPRSDHWLGQGVYFFEDILQAKWWADNISSKRYGSFPVIYSANIVANENQVLNLDNNVVLAEFIQFIKDNIKEIDKVCREEHNGAIFDDEGQFRAVFFDYYKAIFGIKVVMFTFPKDFVRYVPDYPRERSEIQWQKKLLHNLSLNFKEKQICVSDKNCITNHKLIYNGEEAEVI